MNALDIAARVIKFSHRNELSNDLGIIFGWFEDYKLLLQREKRYFISETTANIDLIANIRFSPLPVDFLFPIALRRPKAGLIGTLQDINGSLYEVTKHVVLTRWVIREQFLDRFPTNKIDGELNSGAVNDYMFQGSDIIWGPIPNENETIKLDYFKIAAPYHNPDHLNDEFTVYYSDGLFHYAMKEIYETWIPNDKQAKIWQTKLARSEMGLKKYQIGREMPMESVEVLNLPDN